MDKCDYFPEPLTEYDSFVFEKYWTVNRPQIIHFELTHRCNEHCIHCLLIRENKDELSTDEIFEILMQLQDLGVFYLSLSGGEIFVRKDIDTILDFLCEHRFMLTIYTNGILLNSSHAKKMSLLKPRNVEISVYGSSPEVHDSITNLPGSFEKTIACIKTLRQLGINTVLKGFLLRDNFHQRWGMVDLANEIGTEYAIDFNLFPRISGDISNLKTGITTQQLRELYADVGNKGLILRNNVAVISRENQLPIGGNVICNAARIAGCIGPNGDVYPCPVLRLAMGNLKEKTFEQIWQTDKVDGIRYMKLEDLKTCSNCSILEYCNRCPGVAYLETGDYLGPAVSAVCSKTKALSDRKKGGETI